jgi:ABC-type branched-subunit amino acid transport system substrate-binding protein
MNSVRRRTLIAGAAAALVAHAARAQSKSHKIVLGQTVPLTGAADQIGTTYAAGAKLFFDQFNRAKNNPGFTFELQQVDDGYDAARAAANATKLLDGGAQLLFGSVGTASGDAVAEVAHQRGTLLFAPFAGSDHLRQPGVTWVANIRPSLSDEAFKMVRHCATLAQDRIAVVADDDAMGRAGLAAVQQAITELKLPPLVAQAFVPVNSGKVDGAVASILKASPQAIIQVALFSNSAAFIRKARASGYAGALMNFSVVGIDPLFAVLGKDVGGVVMTQVVPSPRSTTVPIVKEYLAAIDTTTDQTPSYESLEGYIAAKTLAEAVRRSGKPGDLAALQKTLAGMADYDVGGFRVNLRAGVREAVRSIDLVTLTPEGRVVR